MTVPNLRHLLALLPVAAHPQSLQPGKGIESPIILPNTLDFLLPLTSRAISKQSTNKARCVNNFTLTGEIPIRTFGPWVTVTVHFDQSSILYIMLRNVAKNTLYIYFEGFGLFRISIELCGALWERKQYFGVIDNCKAFAYWSTFQLEDG